MHISDIFERSMPVPESGCWIWMGATNSVGYGYLSVDGKQQAAHRLSFELANGAIPSGMCIMHKCDVRPCVNPTHLIAGSQQENLRDMRSKNRGFVLTAMHGESNPKSKLTASDVTEIRRLRSEGLTTIDLSQLYDVSTTLISNICNRKLWKHLED